MKQPWQEQGYRPTGGTMPPPYVSAETQPSPATTRPTGSHVPSGSRINGSGSTSSTNNTTHQTRHNLPQCKLPRCDKPAIFDHRINEQREYCEEHIRRAISVGFAGCCLTCQNMPARLDSEFCSEACRNSHAASSSTAASGYPRAQSTVQDVVMQDVRPTPQPPPVHSQQPTVQPAAKLCENCHSSRGTQGKRPCSGGECANAQAKKRSGGSGANRVPEGLGPACQDCRRPMKDSRSRYCSKECEEAGRRFGSSSRSK